MCEILYIFIIIIIIVIVSIIYIINNIIIMISVYLKSYAFHIEEGKAKRNN